MGNPILAGNTAPLFQDWKVKWSPSTGGDFTCKYLGLDINQMLSLAQLNAAGFYTCDLSYSKNIAELTISSTDPTAQGFSPVFSSIVDRWEVGVDQEKPELFENSSMLSLFAASSSSVGTDATYGVPISQQVFQCIKQCSQNTNANWASFVQFLNATDAVDSFGTPLPDGLGGTLTLWDAISTPPMTAPIFLNTISGMQGLKFYVEEYFRGRTNFARGKYLLRHTTMAPNNYSLSVAEFNIEKIYSISQLLTECQSSSLWILPLPNYLAYKILGYPIPVNMPPLYQWGALKMRSNAVTAGKGRIEITQEYLIDAISVPTYGTL